MNKRERETSLTLRSEEKVKTKLARISRKAGNEPKFRFTSLFHLINQELLQECFKELRHDAASGIDGVTKASYSENLEENLDKLVSKLHEMRYKPQPVVRKYIPKPGSEKQRPLGIPALEDKLVQLGLVRILEKIYENDFIRDSYGFRPRRSCHDALKALSYTVEKENTNWIVDADIKGFFDNLSHDWLGKFLEHRIGDRRVLQLIKRFLKAGIVENALVEKSDKGTPQGGPLSPLLANIYLHYTLDLWFEKKFRKSCKNRLRLIRYCDDFVVCFENQEEAERFYRELSERLEKFSLELEPSKTRLIEFGPKAEKHAKQNGNRGPETFDFLGFTHYCGKSCKGKGFRMKRVTSGKQFRAKLRSFKEWLKRNRCRMRTNELWRIVSSKLKGHFLYYGISDNFSGITRFAYEFRKLLMKWLNKRGGRRELNWEKFNLMEKRFPLPKPRIMVKLY